MRNLVKIPFFQDSFHFRKYMETKDAEKIYLDYNATTPLDAEVIKDISEALINAWGNPSSSYKCGVRAKELISKARRDVAYAINAKPSDVVFTSGGTESNNWVIHTAITDYNLRRKERSDSIRNVKPHVVSTTVEHDSISLPLKSLADKGEIDLTLVSVSMKCGFVTADDVAAAVRPNTCLVTVMMANNETGTIMPIKDICEAVKRIKHRHKPFVHTDAAQTLGKIDVDVCDLGVDYLTIVGHKFYGPRIGALYVKNLDQRSTPLHPLLFGGGQERNYRPGTENTPMIVGLGTAARISKEKLKEFAKHMETIRDFLERELMNELGIQKICRNCCEAPRLPNTSNVSFVGAGLEGYKVLQMIRGFSGSTGSACHSDKCQPSQTLMNFHVPFHEASNAIRFSVGRSTSYHDIRKVVAELKNVLVSLQLNRK